MARFTGEILQRPPMYSALKHEGQRLYELARRGEEVEREARPVRITELRLIGFGEGLFELDVRCSKGTYIRSLVEDLAAAVGQCAHVAALRRLEAGPFREDGMVTPERLEHAAEQGLASLDGLLLDPLAGLPDWNRVQVSSEQAARLGAGQQVRLTRPVMPGRMAIVDARPALLGLGEVDASGLLSPRRWLS